MQSTGVEGLGRTREGRGVDGLRCSMFTYILHSTKGRVKPKYHGKICNEVPNRDLVNMRFDSYEAREQNKYMSNKKVVYHHVKIKQLHTPNVKLERCELRNVIGPSSLSENKPDKKTRYADIIVMNIAWTVDIPLEQKRIRASIIRNL